MSINQIKTNPFAKGPSTKNSKTSTHQEKKDTTRENVKRQLLNSLEARLDNQIEGLKYSSEQLSKEIEEIIFEQNGKVSQNKDYRDRIRKIEMRIKGNRNNYIREMLKKGIIEPEAFCKLDEKTLNNDNYFKGLYGKDTNPTNEKGPVKKIGGSRPPALHAFHMPKIEPRIKDLPKEEKNEEEIKREEEIPEEKKISSDYVEKTTDNNNANDNNANENGIEGGIRLGEHNNEIYNEGGKLSFGTSEKEKNQEIKEEKEETKPQVVKEKKQPEKAPENPGQEESISRTLTSSPPKSKYEQLKELMNRKKQNKLKGQNTNPPSSENVGKKFIKKFDHPKEEKEAPTERKSTTPNPAEAQPSQNPFEEPSDVNSNGKDNKIKKPPFKMVKSPTKPEKSSVPKQEDLFSQEEKSSQQETQERPKVSEEEFSGSLSREKETEKENVIKLDKIEDPPTPLNTPEIIHQKSQKILENKENNPQIEIKSDKQKVEPSNLQKELTQEVEHSQKLEVISPSKERERNQNVFAGISTPLTIRDSQQEDFGSSRLDFSLMSTGGLKEKFRMLNEAKIILETELEVTKRENSSYVKEIASLKSTISSLREKSSISNEESMKIELVKLKQIIKSKDLEIASLSAENQQLRAQLKSYQENTQSMITDNKIFREETEKRFKMYQKENESLRLELVKRRAAKEEEEEEENQESEKDQKNEEFINYDFTNGINEKQNVGNNDYLNMNGNIYDETKSDNQGEMFNKEEEVKREEKKEPEHIEIQEEEEKVDLPPKNDFSHHEDSHQNEEENLNNHHDANEFPSENSFDNNKEKNEIFQQPKEENVFFKEESPKVNPPKKEVDTQNNIFIESKTDEPEQKPQTSNELENIFGGDPESTEKEKSVEPPQKVQKPLFKPPKKTTAPPKVSNVPVKPQNPPKPKVQPQENPFGDDGEEADDIFSTSQKAPVTNPPQIKPQSRPQLKPQIKPQAKVEPKKNVPFKPTITKPPVQTQPANRFANKQKNKQFLFNEFEDDLNNEDIFKKDGENIFDSDKKTTSIFD